MTAPKLHQPTVNFLVEMSQTVSNDAETAELLAGIADTLGDMLGSTARHREVTMRFMSRLTTAAEAAHKRRVLAMQ